MSALFTLPAQQLFGLDGDPVLGAKAYFYEIGTSTQKNTYIDAALSEAHPNPVVADAFGIFPPIWLDESGTDYTLFLTDQFDVEIRIVDGLLSQTTPQDLLNDIITVDGDGSGLDADLLDGLHGSDFGQVAEAQTITGVWNFDAQPTLFGFAMGYLGVPMEDRTGPYTLRRGDNGKGVALTSGGIIIPVTSTFPFEIGAFDRGHCTVFYNDSNVNQTIIAETPATTLIRLVATGSTGNRVLAQHGIAVLYQWKLNEWLVYGAGVS